MTSPAAYQNARYVPVIILWPFLGEVWQRSVFRSEAAHNGEAERRLAEPSAAGRMVVEAR